ncbi:hypothetical protein B0T24DRAFT_396938 [Lasiosphaeria ovina]|uniref:Uncharacterized protein n=1 Tax=Lasiosphaeria ovina TaxID=92902 RepID=A0AAE0N176_9PEZI|nr:hypothetical protein B0T24DRAFT_396938 [Lasiosphaeria ovina]
MILPVLHVASSGALGTLLPSPLNVGQLQFASFCRRYYGFVLYYSTTVSDIPSHSRQTLFFLLSIHTRGRRTWQWRRPWHAHTLYSVVGS